MKLDTHKKVSVSWFFWYNFLNKNLKGEDMSKKLFSDKEVSKLTKNKNILKISNKSIAYSFEFKKKFIEEYYNGRIN